MTTIAPYVFWQELDDNGDPLSGGLVYTYEAGTNTPKATYTDSTGAIQNSNPVVLDASGRAAIWLGDGGYKFVLNTSAGSLIATRDNIGGSSDSAFGGQVNTITTNTNITAVYKNSANVVTGTTTLTLLPAATAGEGFYITAKNAGVNNVTIDPDAGELIDGSATKVIGTGQSALIITDGSQWYTFFLATVSDTGNNTFSGTNTFTGKLLTPVGATLTISSGSITPTANYHLVDTEAAAAIDQLDTISGAVDGEVLTIRTANDARDIVITTAGNIQTPSGSNSYLLTTNNTVSLRYDLPKTKWLITSSAVDPVLMQGLKDRVLNGLVMSNNVTDATNDIDVAAGSCVSDDGTTVMTLSSSITKQLDVAWAVGTNQGGRDTGAISDNTWHVWVIARPDTGVVDVLLSLSPSAPTMPTNYTKKKCIGSIIRASGAILPFLQYKDEFWLKTPVLDVTNGATGTAANLGTLASLPAGARVRAFINAYTSDNGVFIYISSPDFVDLSPSGTVSPLSMFGQSAGAQTTAMLSIWTNTTQQVRYRTSVNTTCRIVTLGWKDTRI